MKKSKKGKYQRLYIGLVVTVAVLVVVCLSVFAVAEVNRSKDCVDVRISSEQKAKRCANGYVGLPLKLAKQKAENNNLLPVWYNLGDENYIIPDSSDPVIFFAVKYGIVVNAHMNH